MANQQFQGALALTIGTIRAQSVTMEVGEKLLESLAAIPLEDGRYYGRLATWLAQVWVPAVRPSPSTSGRPGTIEQAAASALAGRTTANDAPISWEGLQYVVDFAGTTKRRLEAVRAHEGGLTLDSVLELERIVSGLQGRVGLAHVGQYGRDLGQVAPTLIDAKRAEEFGDDAVNVRDVIEEAVRDIAKIKTANDLSRAPEIGKHLTSALDFLTGHVLAAWAYAPHVGEADGPALVGGDPSLRHQFGVRAVGAQKAAQRWSVNRFSALESGISGSLLGLEASLARWSSRRLTIDEVPAVRDDQRQRHGFVSADGRAQRWPEAER